MFQPKRDIVTRGRRKLHDEELHKFHSSPNIIRMMKSRIMTWAGHVVRFGEMRNTHKILVGGKRPYRRPKCIWENNIKTDLEENEI
jgi:hypothetical protein